MNSKQASIGKVIFVDYWAFLSAAMAVLAAGFLVYNTYISTKPIAGLDLIALAAVLLGAAGLVWRVVSISSIITNGEEIKATVSDVSFYRGRGFIKYTYPRDGKTLMGKTTVNKTAATSQFRVGQEITIAVNQGRSLIKDLFV